MREFKKRISGADEVLYIWEGLTGRPRPSADQRASQSDAKLHPSGTAIIAQETGNSKTEASAKSEPAKEAEKPAKNASKDTNRKAEKVESGENKKAVSVEENIANGKKAIQKVIDTHEDVENAMYRKDVGNIDFVWGEEGRGAKFKGGYGIAHIIAKRNSENGSGIETINKLVEVIAKGKDKERQESDNDNGEPRLKIHYDGYTAVLSLKDTDKNTWLLTGWEDSRNNKEATVSANGEGYDSTIATAVTPTLTRRNGETAASINSIPQEAKSSNQQTAATAEEADENSAAEQTAETSAKSEPAKEAEKPAENASKIPEETETKSEPTQDAKAETAKAAENTAAKEPAPEKAPAPKAAVKKPKPDKNGVVPIYANNHNRYFEGEELEKVRVANTEAIMKAAQAIADKYDQGELPASDAKAQITALYKRYYSKANVKPYTDDLQEQINELRKEIAAKEKEKAKQQKTQKQQKTGKETEEAKAEEDATQDIVDEASKTIEGDPSELEELDDKTREALNEALTEDELADLEGAATDSELDKDADAGRRELEDVILVDYATTGKLDDGFNDRLKKLEKYFADEDMSFESTKAAMEKYGRLLIRTLAAAEDTFVKAGGVTTRGYKTVIASNEEARRSHEEILGEMRDALPNGSFKQQDNGAYEITMPNGAKVGLNIKDRIIINASEEEQAKASHGIGQNESIVILGSWEKLTGKMLDGFLNLSRESRKGTAFHEVFHAAWDLALTKREQAALLKYFSKIAQEQGRDVYEVMADAYADWELARRRERSSTFGKLWQKIKDFARRLRNAFTGMDTLHDIMQRIETGEVWEQSGDETQKNSGARYAVTNRRITGETLVPIVDVTELAKTNPKSYSNQKAIAKILQGQQIEILGEGPIGRVNRVSDGKHIVMGAGNPAQYNTSTRKKITTALGQLTQSEEAAASQILSNAIYIEKRPNELKKKGNNHPDVKHWIELFVPIRNGNNIYCYKITGYELDNTAKRYELGKVEFYNIQEKNPVSSLSNRHIPGKVETRFSNVVSVAELLANVKDRNKKPYINEYGGLNYESEALRGIRYSVERKSHDNAEATQSNADSASNQGSNADPDVAALRKKYKGKLDKAFAQNAASSEIAEIMNKYQEELAELYERKKLERKESSRVRAAELRELRKAFKAGEIDSYQVGGVTIYRDEAGNEGVKDVNDDFAARTYVNRRREGKTFANATQKIDDTMNMKHLETALGDISIAC